LTLNSGAHKEVLLNLISFSIDLSRLKKQLALVDWDQTEELVTLNFFHVKNVIERFLSGGISVKELEDWANLLECREDLNFENEYVEGVIYRLANPVLEGEISEAICRGILEKQ